MMLLIEGCKRNDRESQRLLYMQLYGFAMSICLRYSRTHAEAQEVLNDGFMNVFRKIEQYRDEASFHGWIRRIMINSAVDHYRRERKHYDQQDVVDCSGSTEVGVLDDLAHEELIHLIQELSPAYRAVFNLYVIDGYSHKEIGEMLNISEGTSKSNLLKARAALRKSIQEQSHNIYAKNVG